MILAVLVALGKLAAMVVLTFALGNRVIPWLLNRAAATRSRELFTLTVLVVALGIAVGSVKFFGVSMALGAFLAGMVVGRTEFSLRAATEALPLRDAFAVLFFVSVGILFRPWFLLESPGLVFWSLMIVVVAKPLVAFTIVALFKYPPRTALTVALATAQIGEFSFILASVGDRLGVLSDAAGNALTATAIISITLNPLLYKLVGPLERALKRLVATASPATSPEAPGEPSTASRFSAIIVGHGPVGRTLARLLRENSVEPVIVELNVETVRLLIREGMRVVHGDATRRETLEAAGVGTAVVLFLSGSNMEGTSETVRIARQLNPKILIVARATFLAESAKLRAVGADVVFSEEGEVALAMTEFVLRQLGATPEQIDRQRERVRSDLFPDAPGHDTLASTMEWRDNGDQTPPG